MVITLCVLFVVAAGAFFTGRSVITYLRSEMPSVEELERFEPQLTTKMLDRNGQLIKELYTQRRFWIPLSQTPQHVIQAFLAIEDHRFYQHWGIRPWALAAAVGRSMLELDFHFRGASTITQQLARDLYYSPQRRIVRKLREALTAVEIERYYSKDEILEMYLTQLYFGSGAYGIGSAANTYFSKPVSELTIEEAATLAAIPKSPTRYNPLHNPENNITRRNVVLMRMRDLKYITPAQYDSLSALPLNLKPASQHGSLGIAPYFTENVRQRLNTLGRQLGFDPYRDGLTVHTTLDARLQACVEAAIDSNLKDLQSRVNVIFREEDLADYLLEHYPDSSSKARRWMAADNAFVDSIAEANMPVQVAFVVLDPATGYILAMVGGRNFEETKWNRATQMVRDPGSSFKPFLYATVIDQGVPLTTLVSNERVVLRMADSTIWPPANFDNKYGGYLDLRTALMKSVNMVAIRLIQDYTSPRDVVRMAHRLGITTTLHPYDALALGASGVNPIEMAAAYQVFQSLGIWSEPMSITQIDDESGQPVARFRPNRKVVLSEQTAFLVQTLLRSVADHGTGQGLRYRFGFKRPVGGKTGTTNDFTDAWFVGFTPHLVAACWVGIDDPSKSLGKGQEGSRAALPIWATFMVAAYDTMNYPNDDFTMPPGIVTAEICTETGKLAAPGCPDIREEYFIRKFGLPDRCTKHTGPDRSRGRGPSLF